MALFNIYRDKEFTNHVPLHASSHWTPIPGPISPARWLIPRIMLPPATLGNLICIWPCIISVGKVIQKNQLDATITIYWSPRSTQHVSGNLLPIFRSVRLRFFTAYVIVSCCCGRQEFGKRQHATLPLSEPLPTTTTGHYTICCKKSVLRSWRWAKDCPKHVELILEINKLLLLHLVGFSILLYLH